MDADIHTLYTSDFYRILDFKCRCSHCNISAPEYSDTFSISFIRKGNFLFHVYRNSFDAYSGGMLISKPGYEHRVTHLQTIPDECTIIDFTNEFYGQLNEQYQLHRSGFFSNHNLHSLLLNITPEAEYLHLALLQKINRKSVSKILVDSMVMELIEVGLNHILDHKPVEKMDDALKKNHLTTIERAKEYFALNFTNDISLFEIASNCYVSPFHFSRIFKTFTDTSPHQYLMQLRLKHAELLLKNTSLPVTDVCFSSGFNSTQYFISAFKQKYHHAPSYFRATQQGILK